MLKLISFSTIKHSELLYSWYESGKYPMFFRALDSFYTQEIFAQLPAIMNCAIMIVEDDGIIIGAIQIHDFNRVARSCSLGIMLTEEHQGVGNCAKAMALAAQHLVNDKGVQKISCVFDKEDDRIMYMVDKYSLVREGEFERDAWVNGNYKTTVSYAFFAEKLPEVLECLKKQA